ncbi:hypothetical protein HNQ27_18890 [Pseudomonas sp. B11D7D]|nr:hypothetical protein [Pseudomonas sp. B11D7D]QNH04739.1 hypothetical protein HNQ27_18890 [Pseudomonas sp. B11D7D]
MDQYIPAAFRCKTWGAACGSAKAASPMLLESSQAVASNNRANGAISHLLDMACSLIDVWGHRLAGEVLLQAFEPTHRHGAMTAKISQEVISALVDYWQILA